jgi:RpiR family transcriptional regulator, carbohydrate utilization regulator
MGRRLTRSAHPEDLDLPMTTRSIKSAVENQPASSPLARLRHLQADLPPTAKRIAAYIETHASDIIRMSITELAEQTEASEGSIIGLCRRLGASGFQELKILLAGDLVEPVQFIQEDLHEGDSIDQVSDRIFAAHASSLADTRKLLSTEALARAVGIIRDATRVEVYGIGSSGPIAIDLAYRFLQLGLRATATIDSHMQAVNAAMTGPEVAVVTVSHSGSTVETVLATRLATEAGAKTIGITRLGKSPLQRYCEVVLHTVANETRYRPEAMSSRVAQLAIVDTLVSCCALADPQQSIATLQRSARVIAEKRY